MLNIESVKGIIIAPNGTFKSFGVHSDDELDEMNFHDTSFKIDLANSSWFKRLKKECGIDYINNVCASAMKWTENGVITMINAGAREMEAYCILIPTKISIKPKPEEKTGKETQVEPQEKSMEEKKTQKAKSIQQMMRLLLSILYVVF